jgi:putative transposase
LLQEAVISGVSTRKVAKLVAKLGITSRSKSQVSEFCVDLGSRRGHFETSAHVQLPVLVLDAVFEKIHIQGTAQSQARVIAFGVREDGVRDLFGRRPERHMALRGGLNDPRFRRYPFMCSQEPIEPG